MAREGTRSDAGEFLQGLEDLRRDNAGPVSAVPATGLSQRRVLALWWPLALSWLLMGIELPLLTACVARMPDPKVNLAAYGSLVFPIALVIEAPIMMLLSAATALAVDQRSWLRVWRFMHKAGAGLTALHALVAFTPLLDWIGTHAFNVPLEVLEPARLGLRLMLPWTWAIAYRRTHQGVLIRFERGRPVVIGTLVRLAGNGLVYAVGFLLLKRGVNVSGIAIGASAVSLGVVSEAIFIGWCTRTLLSLRGLPAGNVGPPLTRLGFLRFYTPLALTPLIALLTQPIGVAAMGRMPARFDSLAAWPALHGLFFAVRTGSFAFNEVVLSLLARRGGARALWVFGLRLGVFASLVLLLFTLPTVGDLWFGGVTGLAPELRMLAAGATTYGILWPLSQTLQSWFQGALVHGRRTRIVSEAMVVFFLMVASLLALGVGLWAGPGAHFAVLAITVASLSQTAWLALRYRAVSAAAVDREGLQEG